MSGGAALALQRGRGYGFRRITVKRFLLAGVPLLAFAVLPGVSATATAGSSDPNAVQVSAGYADTLRGGGVPSGWTQSSVFIGNSGPYDSGALLLNNPSNNAISVDDVSVNVGGTVTDIWGSFIIPPKGSAILTQTANWNFDTSDEPVQQCSPDGVVPTVTVTVANAPQHPYVFADYAQVLNTGGIDLDTCKNSAENHGWVRTANVSDASS